MQGKSWSHTLGMSRDYGSQRRIAFECTFQDVLTSPAPCSALCPCRTYLRLIAVLARLLVFDAVYRWEKQAGVIPEKQAYHTFAGTQVFLGTMPGGPGAVCPAGVAYW